jgi:hypothetical protein
MAYPHEIPNFRNIFTMNTRIAQGKYYDFRITLFSEMCKLTKPNMLTLKVLELS